MKKVLFILLFCTSSFALGSEAKNSVKNLVKTHSGVNDTHEKHRDTFDKIKTILKEQLLTKQNLIFELERETELLFLSFQAEAERENIVIKSPRMLLK